MTAYRETLKAAVLGALQDNYVKGFRGAADDIVAAVMAVEGQGGSVEWREEWRVCAGPADDPAVFKDGIRNEEHLGVVLRHARDRWSGEYIWAQHRRVGTTDWEAVSPDA